MLIPLKKGGISETREGAGAGGGTGARALPLSHRVMAGREGGSLNGPRGELNKDATEKKGNSYLCVLG